ncbi:DNA-binding response regulator [Clostridia bacterium]|nr:DNA-binding response regulator [Clostridia bacterium]
MDKYNILIVDDDAEILESLKIFLNAEYNPITATNGVEAVEAALNNEIHLILMDIMMPKMNGMSAIVKIRAEKQIPIIIISAKTDDAQIVKGLNIGADDYIKKPFNLTELSARIKSNLRRYVQYDSFKDSGDEFEIRGLRLNKSTKEITLDGADIKLTPIEFRILELLMENVGVVYSIEEIYQKVWNEPFVNGDNTVAVHIRRIREKIEANPKEPIYLKVVWGVGYKIEK